MQKASAIMGGRIGWDLVRHQMDRQIEQGKCQPDDWADELNGMPYQAWVLSNPSDPSSRLFPVTIINHSKEFDRFVTEPGRTKTPASFDRPRRMDSWLFYLWWLDEHQGQEVPRWVKSMWTDEEFERLCASAYVTIFGKAKVGFVAAGTAPETSKSDAGPAPDGGH